MMAEQALELNQQLIENRADCYLGERHYMDMLVPFTLHYQMQIVFQLSSSSLLSRVKAMV